MPASKVMRKLVCPTFCGLESIHAIMRNRAVTNPRYVIDSASQVPSNSLSSRVEGEEGEEHDVEHEPGSMAPETTPTRSMTPTVTDRTPYRATAVAQPPLLQTARLPHQATAGAQPPLL